MVATVIHTWFGKQARPGKAHDPSLRLLDPFFCVLHISGIVFAGCRSGTVSLLLFSNMLLRLLYTNMKLVNTDLATDCTCCQGIRRMKCCRGYHRPAGRSSCGHFTSPPHFDLPIHFSSSESANLHTFCTTSIWCPFASKEPLSARDSVLTIGEHHGALSTPDRDDRNRQD